MARDLAAEPHLPMDDIQGDVPIRLLKRVERLTSFHISDVGRFKQFVSNLRITSARDCLNQRALVDDRKAKGIDSLMPTPRLNIAFTQAGLGALDVRGIDTARDLQAFSSGMGSREAILGDPPQREWAAGEKVMQISARGGCAQATRTADAEPAFAAVWHCKVCQRQAGTAFAALIAMAKAAVTVKAR